MTINIVTYYIAIQPQYPVVLLTSLSIQCKLSYQVHFLWTHLKLSVHYSKLQSTPFPQTAHGHLATWHTKTKDKFKVTIAIVSQWRLLFVSNIVSYKLLCCNFHHCSAYCWVNTRDPSLSITVHFDTDDLIIFDHSRFCWPCITDHLSYTKQRVSHIKYPPTSVDQQ